MFCSSGRYLLKHDFGFLFSAEFRHGEAVCSTRAAEGVPEDGSGLRRAGTIDYNCKYLTNRL